MIANSSRGSTQPGKKIGAAACMVGGETSLARTDSALEAMNRLRNFTVIKRMNWDLTTCKLEG
jgi:hypothetical protein